MKQEKLIAVISGAERGLGHALTKLLKNYEVYSLDIKKGKPLKNKKYIKTNITNEENIKKTIKKIKKIDLLINNAAIMKRGTIYEATTKDFEEAFTINVKGTWLLTKHALPKLNKNAKVIMISSRHQNLPLNPGLYGLTKKNVLHLAELLKKEPHIKQNKIQIKTAILGPFNTELSRTGYTKQEYKKRNTQTKEEIAKQVHELITTNKKQIKQKS